MQLHQAMIYFKNLDQMATFYGNTLGLPIVTTTRTDTWVEFGTGTATLHRTPPQPREENPIKLIFGVKDLESECAHLQTLGVDLIMIGIMLASGGPAPLSVIGALSNLVLVTIGNILGGISWWP